MKAQDFIKKLTKLNFTKENGGILSTEDGRWTLSYHVNLHERKLYPIKTQIVANLRYDGGSVMVWGFECYETQDLLVDFYIKTKMIAQDNEWSRQQDASNDGRQLFNNN